MGIQNLYILHWFLQITIDVNLERFVWGNKHLKYPHLGHEQQKRVLFCRVDVFHDALSGGQVVSALDFRSKGRWFEPGHCRRVVSLDKKLYFTLSLFTQVYKWVRAIIMLGDNLAMD